MDFQPHLLSSNPFITIHPIPSMNRTPGGIDEGKGSEEEGRSGGEPRRAERWLELLMTVDLHALPWFWWFTHDRLLHCSCGWKVPHHTSGPNVNWQPSKPLRLCYWIPGWHRRSAFNYKPHYFHCGLEVWHLERTQNSIAPLSESLRKL